MKILKDLDLDNVVFFDIETVNGERELTEASPLYAAWAYKNKFGREPIGAVDIIKSFNEQAALYAEFGKIVCLTVGKIKDNILKLKSFVGEDEKQVLTDFSKVIGQITAANKKTILCGHAIKGFDVPWIVRRCVVNQVDIPNILDTNHLKPWEMTGLLDTMELWKGTAFNSASLLAISSALGLNNPKDDLAGYQTSTVYYNDPNWLEQIQRYCEKDVAAVAQIVRRCRYELPVEVEVGEIKIKQVGVLNRVYNAGEIKPDDEKDIAKKVGKLKGKKREIAEEILGAIKN